VAHRGPTCAGELNQAAQELPARTSTTGAGFTFLVQANGTPRRWLRTGLLTHNVGALSYSMPLSGDRA
jgi:hypothetical protein